MKARDLVAKMSGATHVRFLARLSPDDNLPRAFMDVWPDDFRTCPELAWVLDKDVEHICIRWTDRAAEITVSLH